jgi:hypothetical protein
MKNSFLHARSGGPLAGLRRFARAGLMVCTLIPALAGCATSQIGDSLPASMGGLPQGAPQRPLQPADYPAVHDMPPPRTNTTLSEEEVKRAEQDLNAVRARQEPAAPPKAKKSTR